MPIVVYTISWDDLVMIDFRPKTAIFEGFAIPKWRFRGPDDPSAPDVRPKLDFPKKVPETRKASNSDFALFFDLKWVSEKICNVKKVFYNSVFFICFRLEP